MKILIFRFKLFNNPLKHTSIILIHHTFQTFKKKLLKHKNYSFISRYWVLITRSKDTKKFLNLK